MALIFYSLSGEGRGHATRVRTMIEALRPRHDIVVFAPGDAYEFLAPRYAGSNVRVHRIPGLHFRYTPNHVLDFWQTTRGAVSYLWQLPRLIAWMERMLRLHRPHLVITDFEPALPRAALRAGVPFISLDHQHFLVANDLACLPRWLRIPAAAMGVVVRAFYSGQSETILSQFYSPPLRSDVGKVSQVGVLLRPSIVSAEPVMGDHLLAYLRRRTSHAVLRSLHQLKRPVRVYGLGRQPAEGQLEFCPIDEQQFVDDLASCQAVVCTAGNQLVGEAMSLGKPVLSLPEPNNFEQFINAWFLRDSGCGDWSDPERLTVRDIRRFLSQHEEFAAACKEHVADGTPEAVRLVEQHLPPSDRPAQPVALEPATWEPLAV